MTLSITHSDKLARLTGTQKPSPVTLSVTPVGRVYMVTVHTVVEGIEFLLYSESGSKPRVPDDVLEAVDQFNSDPNVWKKLIAEALDATEDLISEEQDALNQETAALAETRRKLLGE